MLINLLAVIFFFKTELKVGRSQERVGWVTQITRLQFPESPFILYYRVEWKKKKA